MNSKKGSLATHVYMVGVMLLSMVASAGCGKVTIAEFDHPSAQLVANIEKFLLETVYGCEVELVAASYQVVLASMINRQYPDVVPEWYDFVSKEALESAQSKSLLRLLPGLPFSKGVTGWFVNHGFLQAHPELNTLEAIIDHPEYFSHPEYPGKGVFYGCPGDWLCEKFCKQLFKAHRMTEKGWVLVNPGSASGFELSLSKSLVSHRGWLGFGYRPWAMINKYQLHQVDDGLPWLGDDYWSDCIANEACVNPLPTRFPGATIELIVTEKFAKAHPVLINYLKTIKFDLDVMESMLSLIHDDHLDSESAAIEFFKRYPEVWQSWVPLYQHEALMQKINA